MRLQRSVYHLDDCAVCDWLRMFLCVCTSCKCRPVGHYFLLFPCIHLAKVYSEMEKIVAPFTGDNIIPADTWFTVLQSRSIKHTVTLKHLLYCWLYCNENLNSQICNITKRECVCMHTCILQRGNPLVTSESAVLAYLYFCMPSWRKGNALLCSSFKSLLKNHKGKPKHID